MHGNCLLVQLVIIVSIFPSSQTSLTSKRRSDEHKRYLTELEARRDRQSFNSDCALYDCYNTFWMRPEEITCRTLGQCLEVRMKPSISCKSCTFEDYKWALFEIEASETCDDELDAACMYCFGKLPNIWDPLVLAFDCDTSKLNESEKCFTNLNNTNCLTQRLDIFDVEPHQIFDAIRYRQKGCPLIVIINQCMEPEYGGLEQFDDISQCTIKKGRISEMERCVRGMLEMIPECDISKEVERGFLDSMANDIHKECKRLDKARDLKRACCSNPET